MSKNALTFFPLQLLEWHDPDARPLPWKGIKDPYLIWLSEIILQQTRATQATPYYHKLTERFPTVKALATAPIDELLSLWQGLGYYSRARNLHYSAQMIMSEHQGSFPKTYKDILALKGVGKYTAAAIGSFAFDLPYPVVDGNVIRIISRYFDLDIAVDIKEGLAQINTLVHEVFVVEKAAAFNQAIMDFGATVCIPKNPSCAACPLQVNCLSFANNTQALRPIKTKKIKRKTRHFNFIYLHTSKAVYIQKRTEKDIWQGLYQLPLFEGEALSKKSAIKKEVKKSWGEAFSLEPIFTHKQLLTHQIIHSIVWEAKLTNNSFDEIVDALWIRKEDLSQYGFPKSLTLFLQDNSLI
jgi:A/G-specific adenine glycosylase